MEDPFSQIRSHIKELALVMHRLVYVLYVQIWSEMEQNVRVGLPTPGSDRDKMFKGYSQQLRDVIQEVVEKRRSGEEQESVPFMDSLLQSGVPDEQVRNRNNDNNQIDKCTEKHYKCMTIYVTGF